MNTRSWEFVWTTRPVGMFSRPASGWALAELTHATPDTGWVVAHDIFHHEAGDTGTYPQEVATFGAETWFESAMDPEQLRKQLATSWFSVMGLVIENGTRGVEGLLLEDGARANHSLTELWGEAYRNAIDETRECFGEFAGPDLWEQLKEPAMVERAAGLALEGYLRAQERWPNLKQARRWFRAVEKAAGEGVEGERMVVRIQDNKIAIERQLPEKRLGRGFGGP